MQPMQSPETSSPVRPNFTYSMANSPINEWGERHMRFPSSMSYQRRVKASTGTVLDESWPPVELGGGLDPVRIVGEIAAPLCQGLIEIGQGVEIAVGQRLVDHGPEMLGRLEFRGIGRQELQADAVGDLQILGDMPAGTIEDEHDDLVGSGPDVAGERRQDPAEHRRVDRIGQEPDHIAGCRPDEAVDINPLKALVAAGQRALTPARPNFADDRLEAGAMFVEGPHLDRPVR